MRFWRWRKRGTRNSRPNYGVRNRESIVLKPVFVETIPQLPEMEERTLYVSMRFATLSHLCPCGCGRLVDVTLDPATRSLTYDGEYLTLRPSIGGQIPMQKPLLDCSECDHVVPADLEIGRQVVQSC